MKISLKGILIPNTVYSRSFEDYFDKVEVISYPVVVKAARAGKGEKVYKLDNKKALEEFINELQVKRKREAKDFLMQEYIPYKYDLRCLVIGDKVFTMRRIPGEGEFRANFSLGGTVALFDLDEETRGFAIDALNAVDMSVGGVDVLITENGRKYILEVNHTAGFLGMEKATGENIGKIYVEHAIEKAI